VGQVDTRNDGEAVSTFARLVARYVDVIDGTVADLSLCRELRSALADLYAAAIHAEEPTHVPPHSIDLVTQERRNSIELSLSTRLPSDLYWTALLPETYLTVGDLGIKTIAEDLQEVYSSLQPGLTLFASARARTELKDWWFGAWEVSWGSSAARCIDILHEVINDLSINLYGRSPAPT
jgi:hypothetical protein